MRDILICGDIFRANLELTHRPYNTRWFSRVIRQALEPLDARVEVLGHFNSSFCFENFYRAIYNAPGESVLHKWAEYYDTQSFDPEVSSRLYDVFANKVVVVFEASRSLLNFISSIGGVYLNFRISPLRFGSDLIFIIQTNDAKVETVIRRYRLDQSYIEVQTANLKREMSQKAVIFQRPTLIFLGQVLGDASLICDGQFSGIAIPDGLDVSRFGPADIFHRPHPLDDNAQEIANWKNIFPNSRLLEVPTYAAFCSQDEVAFVTVSSGSGFEAQLLGHECHFVSRHNWSLTSSRWQQFTSILNAYWFTDFWHNVLSALDGDVVDGAPNNRHHNFIPDRLRNAISARWAMR